jgi:quinol monooxygenase YgiN
METATIDASKPFVTLVNMFHVDPQRQEEVLALLQEVTDSVMRHQPGFVSASLHVSLDRQRVVNYVQWESREAFEAALRKPEARAHIDVVERMVRSVEPILYRLVSVHRAHAVAPGDPQHQ